MALVKVKADKFQYNGKTYLAGDELEVSDQFINKGHFQGAVDVLKMGPQTTDVEVPAKDRAMRPEKVSRKDVKDQEKEEDKKDKKESKGKKGKGKGKSSKK